VAVLVDSLRSWGGEQLSTEQSDQNRRTFPRPCGRFR
jgi:hypothetical protein